ncbi:unnamed protein product [Phyllotreta striolata]|uniref:Peptidase M3A/M3B catalytic domain-containing protein n=1 Tax=Phyllotreta striolata TaxID=444603 RepID=A0A9N9XSD3_PHYSR|nr:unnamed protein product [Phyllotreta striolata]
MISSNWSRSILGIKFIPRRYQHGYIILVPEIGEESDAKKPLVKSDGLPEFNNVTIENCRAAVAKESLEFEAGVKSIEKDLQDKPPKDIFKQVFNPLEVLGAPLDLIWGLSKTLYLGNSSLMPTSNYISIHERARQARASKYNNKTIYNAVRDALQTKTDKTVEETRILQKFLIEGKLNGLELEDKNFTIFAEYMATLSKEKSSFKLKNEISTKRFSHVIGDKAIVNDFPDYVLKSASLNPHLPEKGPWKLTLQPHIYRAVLECCPERKIRWNFWQAMVNRGYHHGDRELSTSLTVEEIRFARRDIAKLLGFENFAEMSMQTKMASSVSEVKNVINTLLEEAYPAQENEVKELYEFAASRGFEHEQLELWDVDYWKKQQQKFLYVHSDDDVKAYFPLKSVMNGLFEFCEKMFNIKIKERPKTTVWHKDVKFYDIFEDYSSAPIAGFYFDPYARDQQKIDSSGWMVAIQNKSEICSKIPLGALIFNFDPPTSGRDSCLTFKETKNLFKKFGHNLQHLLTRVKYSEVAGLSNVEWDAVDVCGNVFGHWLENKTVVDKISSHYETGESLPNEMFESLMQSEKQLAGVDLCHEMYLASLDLELHSSKDFWADIVKKLWPNYRCFKLHSNDVHTCSFTRIFVEEWAAAYYSHLWSRMIAADIYSAFYEVRDNEQKTLEIGKRFRNSFLSLGGSVHPGQVFREFRGRDPSPKALLRSLGLKRK